MRGRGPRPAYGVGRFSLVLWLPSFPGTEVRRHAACVFERLRRDDETMRLLGAISLLLFLCSSTVRAGDVLVATRRLELRTHAITLSETVGALLAGEHCELTFEVPGRVIEIVACRRPPTKNTLRRAPSGQLIFLT